ncbi:choline monooxygenase [Scenedesmus sp. PABB004]|nr:choline monooxygenase [Scenedesmus sp. PABB004]
MLRPRLRALVLPFARSAWPGPGALQAAQQRGLAGVPAGLDPWDGADVRMEQASTLPASWYTSPAAVALDQRRVFHNSWQLACAVDEVFRPGDFVCGAIAGAPFLVVRGQDGVLRAFHNVCRHHAAAVAEGSGNAATFTCPYHAWTYDDRGRLVKATRLKGIQGFKASANGLHPIALDTWGPLVLLHLQGGGGGGASERPPPPGVVESLGAGGDARLRELGFADPSLVHVARRTYELSCNWKVFADNYLDGGYHVPVAHADLAAGLDLATYASELHGPRLSIQTCAPRGGGDGGGDARLVGAPAAYAYVWPNLMMNRYGPWLDSNLVLPDPGGAPGRCRVVFDYWCQAHALLAAAGAAEPAGGGGAAAAAAAAAAPGVLEAARRSAFVADSLAASHAVQLEDVGLCEAVQRGLESPAYDTGRYAAPEAPMHHFHRLYYAATRLAPGCAGSRAPRLRAGGAAAAAAASRPARRVVRVRAAAEAEDMVDPMTGEVISRTSVLNQAAGYSVDVDGVRWAYRRSEPAAAKAGGGKPAVLLLHGLGSSSFCWRRTLAMLGEAGYEAFAPDWPGHGESAKPAPAEFDYTQRSYLGGLARFVDAVGIQRPYALVVQGYVLGQYGLLHALEAPEDAVSRLFVLNTPLALSSKLRPELAAYKSPLPFMRPGSKPFDGVTYNMAGSPYAMLEADAMTYGKPYRDDPAASAAVAATMEALDFPALLRQVDEGYRTWRKPSVLLFGANDPFVNVKSAFEFLDSKRTNMRLVTASAKLGHCPQEDYPEALQETLELFLQGVTDGWEPGRVVASKMTKRGLVEAARRGRPGAHTLAAARARYEQPRRPASSPRLGPAGAAMMELRARPGVPGAPARRAGGPRRGRLATRALLAPSKATTAPPVSSEAPASSDAPSATKLWQSASALVNGLRMPWPSQEAPQQAAQQQQQRQQQLPAPAPPAAADGDAAPLDCLAFLGSVSDEELRHMRLLAHLCAQTYYMGSLTPRKLKLWHRLELVSTSLCCERLVYEPARSDEEVALDGDGMAGPALLEALALYAPPGAPEALALAAPGAALGGAGGAGSADAAPGANNVVPFGAKLAGLAPLGGAGGVRAAAASFSSTAAAAAAAQASAPPSPPPSPAGSLDGGVDAGAGAVAPRRGGSSWGPADLVAAKLSEAAAAASSVTGSLYAAAAAGSLSLVSSVTSSVSAGVAGSVGGAVLGGAVLGGAALGPGGDRLVREAIAGIASAEIAGSHPNGTEVKAASTSAGSRCPSEWFVADGGGTRYFVIQGSDSLDHWRTNLMLEPAEFEGGALGGLRVHRGAYEAAAALYERFLPLVQEHVDADPAARVCFTGHSIGGSLAVLLMLMFRHRGVLRAAQVAPVVTFGAPAIFCDGALGACSACGSVPGGAESCSLGGDLLSRLGLPDDIIRGVVMTRDIVPRAFSCDYRLVAELLRSWGQSWREHSCLSGGASGEGRRQLYVHIGRVRVLQPDPELPFVTEAQPHLPMLPQAPGLYELLPRPRLADAMAAATRRAARLRRGLPLGRPAASREEALAAIMDTPHPLETLADPGAYGNAGSISRYHNPDHYCLALGRLLAERRAAAAAALAGAPFTAPRRARRQQLQGGGGTAAAAAAMAGGAADLAPQQAHLVKPKTRKGKRVLEKRGPKLVEDAKRALFLYGNDVSQTVKDAMSDLHKLKGADAQAFTRKNPDVRPFEAGGEAGLQFFCNKSNCSLFVLGSTSKKRPHNLVLGRLYDFHLYDALELGIEAHAPIRAFRGAGTAQVGNKPAVLFVGERFESEPDFKLAKSMLLDMFRGQQVESVNLAGLDRVVVAYAAGGGERGLLLRQYRLAYKKSGTKVPRAHLTEMGPRLDLVLRRVRLPPVDLEKEALRQPKLTKKKEKNVGSDLLGGRVGRIYMPKQTVDKMALAKPKGTKRGRREAAAEKKAAAKRPKPSGGAEAGGGPDGGGSDDE